MEELASAASATAAAMHIPVGMVCARALLCTLVPVLGVRDTVNGPLVEWNSKPGAMYVVEYSDDRGSTWFSAVHRLTRNSTRISWVDRGQPETYTKPANKAARSYRVKRL